MQINFGSGYDNFQIKKQNIRRAEEDRNAEVTGQGVQTMNVSSETILDMETKSSSISGTDILSDGTPITFTIYDTWEEGTGNHPNDNISASDVLKLHSMNYNIR